MLTYRLLTRAFGAVAVVAMLVFDAGAASAQNRPRSRAPSNEPADWSGAGKDKHNEYVVGLAAGLTEGAPLRLAAELARVLDDGDSMRVLPMVTRGPFVNMQDLLLLRGVDAALLSGDQLEHFEKVEKVPRLHQRVTYVASLVPAEVHILARPGINSIAELAGKKVNFNTAGTAAAYTGPLIMRRLGIKVEEAYDPHPQAMAAIRKGGGYDALFWISTRPIEPLKRIDFPAGFKLLSVPYPQELEDLYLPAALDHNDYPKLIPDGQKVQTVSAPVILAIYNWQSSDRGYKRVTRFIDYIFERLPQLQKGNYDPAWKSVNLQASVPGWKRNAYVQQKLDEMVKTRQASAPPSR